MSHQPLADPNGNGFTQASHPDGSVTVTGDGTHVDVARQLVEARHRDPVGVEPVKPRRARKRTG